MRKVAALKALQDKSEEIEVEYRKERIILENKYRSLKFPHLISRDKIISGEVDVPNDDPGKLRINISAEHCFKCFREPIFVFAACVMKTHSHFHITFSEDQAEEAEEEIVKGIPGYWAQCLVNHPAVEDICTTEGT